MSIANLELSSTIYSYALNEYKLYHDDSIHNTKAS